MSDSPAWNHQCWEEEPLEHSAVRCPGEMEGCWKPRHPLKGSMQTPSFADTHLGQRERDSGHGAPETYREKLWLWGEGWQDNCHCSCVEPSPNTTESESALVRGTLLAPP